MARPAIASPADVQLGDLGESPILVIGAGGSIGSALAARLARLRPPELVLLESSESRLDSLQRQWSREPEDVPVAFRLGSVGDRNLLEEIFEVYEPGLVFHAAAFKHVPLLEGQPLAAIENNIFGTLALMEAAGDARVILLSTDKAVEPTSILGATKRVAEQIVLSGGGTALRLGNVLASQGSVVEIFAGQIAAGGPITVTTQTARRYFLTMDEAVNLLLGVALKPERRALLAPRLPGLHGLPDLARFLAGQLAPGREIPIVYTGLRAGEKETEKFWSATDTVRPTDDGSLIFIESPMIAGISLRGTLADLRIASEMRDVAAALRHLQALIPDYTPSPTLLSLAGKRPLRVNA